MHCQRSYADTVYKYLEVRNWVVNSGEVRHLVNLGTELNPIFYKLGLVRVLRAINLSLQDQHVSN